MGKSRINDDSMGNIPRWKRRGQQTYQRLRCDWNVSMLLKTLSRLLILCLFVLLTGCAVSTQISNTQRSSVEQRLLVRSFERALATLDTQEFKGKTVAVDFYGLTPDKDFMKEFFTAWLQGQQVQIATDPKQAQLQLKVFAPVLAVDQGQSFVGAPSFTVPVLGFAIPEISLFKNVKHSGHAEVKIYTIDAGPENSLTRALRRSARPTMMTTRS